MTDIKPVAWAHKKQIKSQITPKQMETWATDLTEDFTNPLYTESALAQAREEGRREGIREAAEVYLHLAEVITRAAEGK